MEEDKTPSSYEELRADLDSVQVSLSAYRSTLNKLFTACVQLVTSLPMLQAELKRLKGLSTLRDPILTFRTYIASTMGHDTWASLAAKLKLESRRGIPKLVHQELDKTLHQQGLSMATWDSVRAVADEGVAEFHRGTDIPAKTVLKSVENNELVPLDLSNAKPAIIEILKFLDSIGFGPAAAGMS